MMFAIIELMLGILMCVVLAGAIVIAANTILKLWRKE